MNFPVKGLKMNQTMDKPANLHLLNRTVTGLLTWVGKLTRTQGLVLGIALSLLLAGVDLSTGYELSFSLFYLVPVFLVAWTGTRPLVWSISAVDAVIWQTANLWAGEHHELTWVYFWNAGTRGVFFVVTGLLVLQLKHLLDREKATARRDPLTNLLNRRGLDEAFEAMAGRLGRNPRPFAVVTIDLDRFKQLNDTRGHGEGDRLLVAFARTASAAVRPTDTLARIGGDEFLVLVEDVDRNGVAELTQRLQRSVEEAFAGQGWTVGISQGVAYQEAPSGTLAELIARADRQLYRAKDAGRGRIVFEDPF